MNKGAWKKQIHHISDNKSCHIVLKSYKNIKLNCYRCLDEYTVRKNIMFLEYIACSINIKYKNVLK